MDTGGSRRADHHHGGIAGRDDPECLAGAGGLGLLPAVGQDLGADLPAVFGAVVPTGWGGDRTV